MANRKISQFDAITTFDDNDFLGGYRGAANIRVSKQQITTAVLGVLPSFEVLKNTAKSANFTQSILANCRVLSIDFKVTAGTPLIKVGTTSGGEELIFSETLTANAMRPVAEFFASAGTMYFTISGGTVDVNILVIKSYF